MTGTEPTQLAVDGELFDVVADPAVPGQYHVTWATGPNPGYGFTTRTYDGRPLVEHQLLGPIRAFLAQIDSRTGYIE